MEEAIDTEIIKATQLSLGKYVKRPPLSDKLLKKPPFRFLHDIITSVIKSTGFFKGLFDDDELISDNVKDRESKILFLSKIITVLGSTTGTTLLAKPTKIVAGQEPENTNKLLQCLAFALDNKLSSDEAVKQYKNNGSQNVTKEKKSKSDNKSAKKVTDSKKLTAKSTERLVKNEKNPTKIKQKEVSLIKKESPPKKISATKTTNKKTQEKEKQDLKESVKENNEDIIADPEINSQNNSDVDIIGNIDNTSTDQTPAPSTLEIAETRDTNADINRLTQNELPLKQESQELNELEINNIVKEEEYKSGDIESINNKNKNVDKPINESNTNAILEPNSDNIHYKEVYKQKQDDNNTTDAGTKDHEPKEIDASRVKRPNSVRPSSSRPGAPRLRDKHENLLSATDNLVIGKVNIIAETATQEEDEESSIVILEHTDVTETASVHEESDQHGHLVQQILDAQKEFSDDAGKANIELKFGAQKARDVLNQDIEQLRFNVQALSRVANPLGKLLDHIQEDVEVMRQELQQWTKSYDDATKELLKQKTANEESLYPLHSKVKQLEADINEKRDKINDLKIIIHKNAFRIEKLLASGNVQY